MRIVGKAREGPRPPTLEAAPELAWAVLGWVGLGLALVAGWDLLLTWLPLRLGSAEWEFATVSSTLNNMPAVALGLGVMLGTGLARGSQWVVRVVAVILGLLAVLILGMGILYLLDVPVALGAVREGPARLGLQKSIAKTTLQAVLYPSVYLWVAWLAWRYVRQKKQK